MAYTLYELIRHPDIMVKVLKEIGGVIPGNQEIADYAHISQLPYLLACFKVLFLPSFLFPSLLFSIYASIKLIFLNIIAFYVY